MYHLKKLLANLFLHKKFMGFSLLVLVTFVNKKVTAQGGNNAISPIWGTSTNLTIGQPLYDAQTWGMVPSRQTMRNMPNRNGMDRGNNNNQQQATRYRNAAGQLLLTDPQGNLVYDMNGMPTVDSVALGMPLSGSVNVDADGGSPPPPPDDPMDVPIDGGVEILIMIGLGVGYKNRKMQKVKSYPLAKIVF